jgi:hypothetical protein
MSISYASSCGSRVCGHIACNLFSRCLTRHFLHQCSFGRAIISALSSSSWAIWLNPTLESLSLQRKDYNNQIAARQPVITTVNTNIPSASVAEMSPSSTPFHNIVTQNEMTDTEVLRILIFFQNWISFADCSIFRVNSSCILCSSFRKSKRNCRSSALSSALSYAPSSALVIGAACSCTLSMYQNFILDSTACMVLQGSFHKIVLLEKQ